MIFQLLPLVFQKFKKDISKPVVLVISPLLSLIESTVKSCNDHTEYGLKAVALDSQKYKAIAKGEYNVVIGTPEAFIQQKRWREMLSTTFYVKNTVCLVVDEAHKVTWGEASGKQAPFRKSFARINELRSLCRINLPVLALSATVDLDITQFIKASCNLSSSLNVISECVDRDNLCLHVVRLETRSVSSLDWILNGLKEHGSSFPKVLIYCRSIWRLSAIIDDFIDRGILSRTLVRRYMKVFISSSFDSDKKKALQSLLEESNTRVVIATSALGCGVNAKDVEYIIHFGPAYDTVDYVQQIGRGGRLTDSGAEPRKCQAILYTYPGCKGGHVSTRMKEYLDEAGNSCLRVKLFSPLNPVDTEIKPSQPGHDCCSYCASKCACTGDSGNVCSKCESFIFLPKKIEPSVTGNELSSFRDVDADEAELVRELLVDFAKKTTSEMATILPNESISGLTTHTIDGIIGNIHLLTSKESIFEKTSVVSERLALSL